MLLRALEPAHGVEEMRARRDLDEPRLLCSGPGRLCQALAVTGEHDGLPLDRPPFELRAREGEPEVVTGPRVGITQAADLPWRYGLAGSPYLSRGFRAQRPTTSLIVMFSTEASPAFGNCCRTRSGFPSA